MGRKLRRSSWIFALGLGLCAFWLWGCGREEPQPQAVSQPETPGPPEKEGAAAPPEGLTPKRAAPGKSGVEVPPKPEFTEALVQRGAELYARHCAACHGEKGRGDGIAAEFLYPRPRNFTRPGFRLVSTVNAVPTDEDLFRTITRGMPGSAMPSWEHLAAEDRWALVAQVRRLSFEGMVEDILREEKEAGREMARAEAEEIAREMLTPQEEVTVPPEPPVTLDELAWGRLLYLQNCAACHDADGRGRSRTDLKDNDGYPIFARDFTQGIFKGSPEPREIAVRLLAGMPQTPMPAYQSFSPEELWAIVHFVRSLVPEGAQDRVRLVRREITARRVAGPLKADLEAAYWKESRPTYVALMPLWWRHERIEGVLVDAVHDGEKIAVRLRWADATQDRRALGHTEFSDAAAVQFSASSDPPLFAMGAKGEPVLIWHWKAHWEEDRSGYKEISDLYPQAVVGAAEAQEVRLEGEIPENPQRGFFSAREAGNPAAGPERPTGVETCVAGGVGTLTSLAYGATPVESASVWDRGMWTVVLVRRLESGGEGDLSLRPGGSAVKVAFAVWDGAAGDRNGQKSVTIWHDLKLSE